jgi:hypothetical protein
MKRSIALAGLAGALAAILGGGSLGRAEGFHSHFLSGTYASTMRLQCQNAAPGEIDPDTLAFLGETRPANLSCRFLTRFSHWGTYVMEGTQCLQLNSANTSPGDLVWSVIGNAYTCSGRYTLGEGFSLGFDMACRQPLPNGNVISFTSLGLNGFVGLARATVVFSLDVPQRRVVSMKTPAGSSVIREQVCNATGTMVRIRDK